MDLTSLTATIASQGPASTEQARGIAAELRRSLPAAPFAGTLAPGSFHADLAGAFAAPASRGAVSSVKLPFTVVFQSSFKPFR